VFLSYASQDQEAAQRICGALHAAGIEVWFDQSELRGGDVWDQKIRRQIHDCALFIPVISANTTSRREGYFRLEWDLADQRSHRMARDQAFIVPVCVDTTPDAGTDVPESFHRVQWTRFPNGATPPEFGARINRLLSPEPVTTAGLPAGVASRSSPIAPTMGRHSLMRRALPIALAVLVVAALAYLLVNKLPGLRHGASITPTTSIQATTAAPTPTVAAAAFNPPPHSIAVLPFVNMSGDKEQEYFSDGLSEELLNDLARMNELQVAARTSAFSFKGKDTDIGTIARKLNVSAVLEGSVRRSAHTVRVTAQLVNPITGFHVWSATYDRNLGDVLKLQTEIAEAVANALKVTLLGDVEAKVELGETHDPAAFDTYLRAVKLNQLSHNEREKRAAIAVYTEAINRDSAFALAYAARSLAFCSFAAGYARGPAYGDSLDKAKADAAKALALAPELAEGHLALAVALETSLDFMPARREYLRALALAPGNARVLRNSGLFSVFMGEGDSGLAAARRAVALDPLNASSLKMLSNSLLFLRRYRESLATLADAQALDPGDPDLQKEAGFTHYMLGDLQNARSLCEKEPETLLGNWCLAVVYDKLGRHDEAQAMLNRLRAARGDDGAYEYAVVYAQWGETAKALEWLEAAMRVHEPKLERVRVNPFLDPVRSEPRFQAIERELKFPN
jgi:TolB-like protein/Flp pilus assembly protein TadD